MTGVGVQHRFMVRGEKASGSVKRWSRYAETKKRERLVNNGRVRVGVAPAALSHTRPAGRKHATPISVRTWSRPEPSVFRPAGNRWTIATFIQTVDGSYIASDEKARAAQTKGVRVMGAGGCAPFPLATQC